MGVFGSHIHRLGLFCLQEIDSGDIVIEYTGTVIRSTLTDYWERFYKSKGIWCYMFQIDSDEVVDTTKCPGTWHGLLTILAKWVGHFWNHGCGALFFSLPFFRSLPLSF